MLTVFHIFVVCGAVGGCIILSSLGYKMIGWPGAVVGAAIGAFVGFMIGRIPLILSCAYMRFDLARTTTEQLREKLTTEYYNSHLLIAELVVRGEPLDQFQDCVVSLIHSENVDIRRHGKKTAEMWFPELLADKATSEVEKH